MAPTKFQIYQDQSVRQPTTDIEQNVAPQLHLAQPLGQPQLQQQQQPQVQRYKPEVLPPNHRFYFDERKLYPADGSEYCFEELNFYSWSKRQRDLAEKRRCEDIERENDDLRVRLEATNQQMLALANALKQLQAQFQQQQQFKQPQGPPSPTMTSNRLSIVPQSLQPTQGLEYTDMSVYGALNDAPSLVNELWKNTFAHDKFTLPIDQSQCIRELAKTSTPTSKSTANNADDNKKALCQRRLSRPSMGGSPTLKLSPITETSRDCNSKSSSSSSAISGTPGTAKKPQQLAMDQQPIIQSEPDRPIDPNDPTTYRKLLVGLVEPLERRQGYFKHSRSLPKVRHGACFQAGADSYLVDKELSNEAKTFTAQLLNDDSNNDDSSMDIPIKTICFRVDQPANEWLYYICNELHKRLVRQKTKPDIELSVMIANPAIMYTDGSILVDEYFRFVTLQNFFDACTTMNKPFPKSVAAYVTLELIQLVRQMHSCGIIHMNINPNNVLLTCCPNREDIANVDERTSIVKLIGFDRAMDTRLLPPNFKFETTLDNLVSCEMRDSRPWSFEVDWYGALACIYKMFFLEDMQVDKSSGRWAASKQFKGCPTGVWNLMFDQLLNIQDPMAATTLVDKATDELTTWVKANISFVLKEAANLDRVYEDYCRETNKSIRT